MAAVEEFELSSGSASDDAGAAPPRHRARWMSGAAAWVAAALALVVIGAATATPTLLIVDRGDGPSFGLVDLDLAQPASVLWTTDIRNAAVEHVRGDRAVLRTQDYGAGPAVIGVDLATGKPMWEYHDHNNSCQFGTRMLCIEHQGDTDASIVSVELDDGNQTSWPSPRALAAIPLGEDVAVIVQTSTDTERVVLLDADGSERWRIDMDAADTDARPVWVFADEVGGELWFQHATLVRLDLTTGTVIPEQPTSFILDDGTRVDVTESTASFRTSDGDAVVDRDEVVMQRDDDLGGPVRLTTNQQGEITAQLREDGTELWRFGEPGCSPESRLAGVVVVICWAAPGPRVYGVDEVTGEIAWHSDQDGWPVGGSADTLILATAAGDRLRAIDPATGALRWELPMPEPDRVEGLAATPISGGMLIITNRTVLRLHWP